MKTGNALAQAHRPDNYANKKNCVVGIDVVVDEDEAEDEAGEDGEDEGGLRNLDKQSGYSLARRHPIVD